MTKGAAAAALEPQPATAAKHQRSFRMAAAMAIGLALTVVSMPSAQAQTYKVLHNFTKQDGAASFAGLTMDNAGNFYGTTYYGGSANHGVIFKLTRNGDGFVYNTLHSFANGEGSGPYGKVTIGPDGGLYGTTQVGVSGTGCTGLGCGTVFNRCKTAFCQRSQSLVYQFQGDGIDGAIPSSAPIFDQNGNMFGTTRGFDCCGNIYALTPSNGGWTQSILYSFTGQCHRGRCAQRNQLRQRDRSVNDSVGGVGSIVSFQPERVVARCPRFALWFGR